MPPLDPEFVQSLETMLSEIGPGVFAEVLQLYLEDAPPRAAELGALDEARVRRQAHAIRGSAASVGAQPLAELCRRLEEAPLGASLSPLVADVQAEMARVVAAIEERLAVARCA